MIYAQWFLAVCLVLRWLFALHECFYGREARRPLGFWGAALGTLAIAIIVFVHWKAGAFSMVLR